jgi:nucleoside-diphosphate-sugar epimerase
LAAGLIAALDRGRLRESYVLSGPPVRVAAAIEAAAAAGGHRPPSPRIPTGFLRALAPFGALVGQPTLRELVAAGAGGVTYWASSAKAERELGFRARDLETGFRDTFGRP